MYTKCVLNGHQTQTASEGKLVYLAGTCLRNSCSLVIETSGDPFNSYRHTGQNNASSHSHVMVLIHDHCLVPLSASIAARTHASYGKSSFDTLHCSRCPGLSVCAAITICTLLFPFYSTLKIHMIVLVDGTIDIVMGWLADTLLFLDGVF